MVLRFKLLAIDLNQSSPNNKELLEEVHLQEESHSDEMVKYQWDGGYETFNR